jgi:hypothetical protein
LERDLDQINVKLDKVQHPVKYASLLQKKSISDKNNELEVTYSSQKKSTEIINPYCNNHLASKIDSKYHSLMTEIKSIYDSSEDTDQMFEKDQPFQKDRQKPYGGTLEFYDETYIEIIPYNKISINNDDNSSDQKKNDLNAKRTIDTSATKTKTSEGQCVDFFNSLKLQRLNSGLMENKLDFYSKD